MPREEHIHSKHNEDDAEVGEDRLGLFIGLGLALGAGLGVAFGSVAGTLTGDIGVGIALGIPITAGMGLAVGLALGIREQRTRNSCPQCGYSTRGLPTNICPECGADDTTVDAADPDDLQI